MALARMLKRAEVEAVTGLTRSTIYEMMRRGQFPEPIRISARAVAWPENEIADWLASRPRASGEIGDPALQRGANENPTSEQIHREVSHGGL